MVEETKEPTLWEKTAANLVAVTSISTGLLVVGHPVTTRLQMYESEGIIRRGLAYELEQRFGPLVAALQEIIRLRHSVQSEDSYIEDHVLDFFADLEQIAETALDKTGAR